ncbi:MAG: ABC transporter permease [Prolixibacteraceae bacterium]|jgi:putative ABC transport system permease protein|nr:ABC transporter permease [Prolixibacteraceae bacterium]
MFKLIIISSLRNLYRNRQFSLINLLGITIALTAFIFIMEYVMYEKSYDAFFDGYERIYRVSTKTTRDGELTYHGAKSPRGIWFSRHELPEIEACSYSYLEINQVRYKDLAFFEQRVFWVEEDYEKIFPFKMMKGEATFNRPLVGIVSESKAKAFFNDEDPIGKIVKINNQMMVEIIGVYEDLPSNTHAEADMFVSVKTWVKFGWIPEQGAWTGNGWWTYFKLKQGCSPKNVEEKLDQLAVVNIPDLTTQNSTVAFNLLPLNKIHTETSLKGDIGRKIKKSNIRNIQLFGIFLLIVAWINYVNISVAQSIKREMTLGFHRLVGASKRHVFVQVLFESFLFNAIALALALLFIKLTGSLLAGYFGIPFSNAYLNNTELTLIISGIFITGIVLSSAYLLVSIVRINPFIRKSNLKEGVAKRGLVIAQLIITIIFISSSVLIYKQLHFMQTSNLGIELERTVILSGPTTFNGEENYMDVDFPKINRYNDFRAAVLRNSSFLSGTATNDLPGYEPRSNNATFTRPDAETQSNTRFYTILADNGFIETTGLKLLAGKPFPKDPGHYQRLALVNKESLTPLGFNSPEEAIGKTIRRWRRELVICGVVENYHHEGLQKSIYPIIIEYEHPSEFGYYYFRLKGENIPESLSLLEKTWKSYYPDDPYNCFFLDEFYNRQYESEQQVAKFNIAVAVISILISCLGLYGIIIFFIARKVKEIGIRKVNGASPTRVVLLLIRNILVWIVIAFIIALPVAHSLLNRWLENFAYKTALSWWIFALAGLLALGIALLTVSWQSWKAATRNPVEALRYE